jgi:hypothetical protein
MDKFNQKIKRRYSMEQSNNILNYEFNDNKIHFEYYWKKDRKYPEVGDCVAFMDIIEVIYVGMVKEHREDHIYTIEIIDHVEKQFNNTVVVEVPGCRLLKIKIK